MKSVKKILILIGKPFFYLSLPIIISTNLLIHFSTNLLACLLKSITSLRPPGIPKFKVRIVPKISFPKLFLKKVAVFILLVLMAIFVTWRVYGFLVSLPSPEKLVDETPILTTKIYDRSHNLLAKIYRDQNRTIVPLEKIPEYLIKATIAIEDKEFYSHEGISVLGVIRAVRYNLTHPKNSPIGGSTITQQLVKNALLSPEKTFARKVKELILTLLVESRFSKNEILQMYLNEIPYGGTAYGVEEASQKYFGKHVWELDLAEATLLAGLPKAPTRYSPFGAYPELAKQRQEQVLEEMLKEKFISQKELETTKKETLKFAFQKETIFAPHFVFYVKDILAEKYGQKMLEQGGLEITTSLDLKTQQSAEKIIKEEVDGLLRFHITNAASLVINPKNGDILAMVGSKDFYDLKNDGNVNVVLRPRQPGSAIKLINYSVALDIGFMPSTIIPDTPITFRTPGQPPYSPRNYDNKFHGNITLRTALASSLNVPAVKVLSSYGVERMIEQGKKLGITTWDDSSRFGLSLTLGGGEVKMIDLAQAYAVFANLGEKVKINPILEIKDAKGETIYSKKKEEISEMVLDPGICFIINDILSDNSARRIAFGLNSLLNIPKQKVAVKTGTTNNLRDNWAIGYTPNILVAAWVGNNNNSPMSYVASGITGATPIWNKITTALLSSQPSGSWLMPNNVVKRKICVATNTLACEACPSIREEYFLETNRPEKYCSPENFNNLNESQKNGKLDGSIPE